MLCVFLQKGSTRKNVLLMIGSVVFVCYFTTLYIKPGFVVSDLEGARNTKILLSTHTRPSVGSILRLGDNTKKKICQ